MIIFLFIITTIMILSFIFLGDYNSTIFLFIFSFILLPPIILNYRNYPERSIYIFLLLWITFPKYIRFLPFIGTYDFPGISYFDILITITVFHISYLLINKGYLSIRNLKIPNNLKNLISFFIITISLTTIFGFIRYKSVVPPNEYMMLGNMLENAFIPFSGVIFFIGLLAFIIKFKQIERILSILVLSGIILLLEHIVFTQINLFPGLDVWAFASDQMRFNSLIFGSYDVKGIFSILSALSILYFAFTRKKYYLIIFAILMLIPISTTYQRILYIAYFSGITVFIFAFIKKAKLYQKAFIFIVIILSLISVFTNQENFNKINNLVTGNNIVRSDDITNISSIYSRTGFAYRAFDIFVYTFPFGIGEGMYGTYTKYKYAPQYSRPYVDFKSKKTYNIIVNGKKQTKTHNIFIQFITEYNILGFIVLYVFLKQLFRFIKQKRFEEIHLEYKILRITTISIIFVIGIIGLFESGLQLYFIYGLIMFFAYFISKSKYNLKDI